MKSFQKLPPQFQCAEVKEYYDILCKKQGSFVLKRILDIFASVILLVFLIIPVTTYGKKFRILKFRTMVTGADRLGTLVTTDSDSRVTKTGRILRKYRLDELPQIFNVLSGSMSIVGTRPEVQHYVDMYEPEYLATLLMPAGITSLASIMYKDEEKLLKGEIDVDRVYVEKILPEKMKFNLSYVKNFSFGSDIKLMFKTVKEVFS